ncbi:MAG: hypothetical protein EXS37_08795 [Opitutus sp.]|nr:hypothetical protein [Opitutus sp.]
MNSSDQNPKLPTWLFIVTDLALIGAAAIVACFYRPLTPTTMFLIVGCVAGGAIFGLVPLVARFERQKNETLDDRQRALEALARTVSSSAEQISIAASGLHEIAELAQKNLRHAEQLPHKLQEKIAEFQAQLASANDAEKEELERELLELRTSESERLDAVSQRIAKSAGEWAKLETAAHQHLAAANDAVAKLSQSTVSAIGKAHAAAEQAVGHAQAAAEQALSHARVEAARTIGETRGTATREIEAAKMAAFADLDARLNSATAALLDRVAIEFGAKLALTAQTLDEKIALLDAAARRIEPVVPPTPPAAVLVESVPAAGSATIPLVETPAATDVEHITPPPAAESAPAPEPVAPPKRVRKPRREEPAITPPADSAAPVVVSEDVVVVADAGTEVLPAEALPIEEPAPIPVETIPEVKPVAPHTAEPFSDVHSPVAAAPVPVEIISEPAPVAEPVQPARKRPSARKVESNDEPSLGLDLDDASGGAVVGAAERVLTSDGATRLIVTAYIGIGNRLYIRGEGPGLSWEKGVPLQFVSIGKWRWETNEANAPVNFKLYKNDDLECSALGVQTLEPGHQHDLSAAF